MRLLSQQGFECNSHTNSLLLNLDFSVSKYFRCVGGKTAVQLGSAAISDGKSGLVWVTVVAQRPNGSLGATITGHDDSIVRRVSIAKPSLLSTAVAVITFNAATHEDGATAGT